MIDLYSSTELKRQKEQNYKTIYENPKSLLRALIQKLFLKILFKLFPKKFSSYKNKIRLIMNINARRSHLLLVSSYLRFRHPRYFIMPSSQIYALHLCLKLLKILKPQNINLFLVGGCLLGAVRQESFAGRPSDLDLGIKEDQFPKLLDAIPLLKKNGAKFIRERFSNNKLERLQIEFPGMLVDIGIYRKKNVEGKEMWENLGGETENQHFPQNKDLKKKRFVISLDYLIPIKAYGKEFLAPCNPEIYLEKKFGKNWRIPDKKQFYWNKKN
jgi:hypothetical protein